MKRITSFAALVAALALVVPAWAQQIVPLALASGRSVSLDAPGLTRVAVGDAKIAGVVPVGTQQVIVNGKAPGHTTVLIWDRSGMREYDVTVSEQTLDELAQMLRSTIATPGVTIEQIGRALVVKGSVPDQASANRIGEVLGRFAGLAHNQHYDLVDAVTVAHPLGELQNALAATTDARDVRVDYDDKGDVIVSGSVRNRAAAEAVLQRVRSLSGNMLAANGHVIDRLVTDVTQQVDTHLYILEVDKSAMQRLGIRLQSAVITPQGTVQYGDPNFPVFDNPVTPGPNGSGALGAAASGIGINKFVRNIWLAPTLDAIMRDGSARVLSSPSLVTMPGSEAKFLVGGEIPYIVPSGLGTVSVQWKQYGVQLDLTPTILPDGSIETKITPEVSDLDFTNGITVQGYTEPALRTSRITTDIVSKPGESIVMAGLLRRQEIRNVDKIPGLSSLPILGKLFQSTSYQKSDSDVVFVMTPEVITR